jgi:hypothetical protein
MLEPTSEMIGNSGYYSCTLEQGDSLAAISLFFGYGDWRSIYCLPANQAFRQAYPDPLQIQVNLTTNPRFYVPIQTGSSGQQAIISLGQLETYCRQIEALERAVPDTRTLITYIRKLYYTGGGWDLIIPGASSINMPASIRNRPDIALTLTYLTENQNLSADGRFVDIGHFFTGLDAKNHQQRLELGPNIWGTTIPVVRLRNNIEIATWVEDLSSVVVEYFNETPCSGRPRGRRSFRDMAMVRDDTALRACYNNWASDADMRGNVDAYVFPFNASQRLSQQFRSYYITNQDPRRQRFVQFRQQLSISNSDSWKNPVKTEVFNGAIAYAGGTGRRLDVINIYSDPGPGVLVPTFWEAYNNITGWVVDMFVSRMMNATF